MQRLLRVHTTEAGEFTNSVDILVNGAEVLVDHDTTVVYNSTVVYSSEYIRITILLVTTQKRKARDFNRLLICKLL